MNILAAQGKVARLPSNFRLYPRVVEACDVSIWLELTTLFEAKK